jgi:uncharacterized membrane protein
MDSSQSDLEAIRRILSELTARVYRIEQQLHIDARPPAQPSAAPVAPPSSPAPPSIGVVEKPAASFTPVVQAPPRAAVAPATARPEIDLESRIGSHWLNRIGIAALLIGISYFLKFAFDNNWIGPAGRVTIGLIAGIAVVSWSERFRTKGYKAFSYSLKAVGIGTLYLSLWAAFQRYNLIPSGVAFAMMFLVTASAAAMALAQDAQILAAFALTGGFSTPLLLSTGENRELALFAYVALLDIATLVLVAFKPWRRLLVMSYAGTLLLYVGWYSEFYTRPQLGMTLAFASLFFAIFAIAPLITLQPEGEHPLFASIPAVLAFVNAGVYFLQAYGMVEAVDKTYMAWFALVLAAIYIFLSRQVHARKLAPGTSDILYLLHLAVAIGFITIAIPIRLDAHWITIGWFVEAGVLLYVANRLQSDFLNAFALGSLALGVARLLLIDNFQMTQLILNLRMMTYAVAIVVLGAVAWYASQRRDDAAITVAAVSVVALNVLALIALSREVADYYARQVTAIGPVYPNHWRTNYTELHRIDIERDFTFSALWMAYGAMLMVVGFLRRSAFVRWQALVLIAFTIAKVFIYDVSQLDRGYRIVSFIVLGVLLLAISFVYQRDWLQLSAKHKAKAERTAPIR